VKNLTNVFASIGGWKYHWVVPLRTTLSNEKGTKNSQ
jgi:hypothetical protein